MINKFNDLETYTEIYRNTDKISGLFSAAGSFGMIDGLTPITRVDKKDKTIFTAEVNGVKAISEYKKCKNGVIIRKDYFKNLTAKKVYLRRFLSRFTLEGRDYKVYTQYNGWQHESLGTWADLATGVFTQNTGSRLCDGATPFMALLNNQTGKIFVFNMLCNCKWKMTAEIRQVYGNYDTVVVEAGMDDSGLNLEVKPKETIEMPEIVFYQTDNAMDFEAYRMHEVIMEKFPKRPLPVLYNTWLAFFDVLDTDTLLKEIDTLSELGIEAFMIDAGWFGKKGAWNTKIGDWEEDKEGYLDGRLKEISDYVKSKGMKFGLWFEPGRATKGSNVLVEKPEYYIREMLSDFSNPEAVDFVTNKIVKAIEKFNVDWVKFDFNITVSYDKYDSAYYRYYQGYKKLTSTLKAKFPDLYVTLCGAGGYMSEMGAFEYIDSIWLSDNQGPDTGLRIVKDYIKRMPSRFVERWDVETYIDGLPHGKMMHLHCDNHYWSKLIALDESYSQGFLKGGPMCFSCKMQNLPQQQLDSIKKLIKEYKENREFWSNAVARILVERPNFTVLQYSDAKFKKSVVQVFTEDVWQDVLTVYPTVNEKLTYTVNGEKIKGADLKQNGYTVKELISNACKEITFIAE